MPKTLHENQHRIPFNNPLHRRNGVNIKYFIFCGYTPLPLKKHSTATLILGIAEHQAAAVKRESGDTFKQLSPEFLFILYLFRRCAPASPVCFSLFSKKYQSIDLSNKISQHQKKFTTCESRDQEKWNRKARFKVLSS